jgi:hypothetical protein
MSAMRQASITTEFLSWIYILFGKVQMIYSPIETNTESTITTETSITVYFTIIQLYFNIINTGFTYVYAYLKTLSGAQSIRAVFWGTYGGEDVDVVLGWDTMCTRRQVPTFRRNIMSPSSGPSVGW